VGGIVDLGLARSVYGLVRGKPAPVGEVTCPDPMLAHGPEPAKLLLVPGVDDRVIIADLKDASIEQDVVVRA
jgi:hypothetical protein